MAKLVKIAVGEYSFKCPGCDSYHQYWTAESPNAKPNATWNFDGNMVQPTFTPSLRNTWGKFVDPNWQEPNEEPIIENYSWSGCCHLFVTNGMIQYCGDCTHKMAGQTVPMVDLPEHFVSRYEHLNQKI